MLFCRSDFTHVPDSLLINTVPCHWSSWLPFWL